MKTLLIAFILTMLGFQGLAFGQRPTDVKLEDQGAGEQHRVYHLKARESGGFQIENWGQESSDMIVVPTSKSAALAIDNVENVDGTIVCYVPVGNGTGAYSTIVGNIMYLSMVHHCHSNK